MPTSRVIPKRLPVAKGRNSHYTLKRNYDQGGVFWVHYEPPGADPIPADDAYEELVSRVNWLKETENIRAGGSFSITEHGQVIARMTAPPGYVERSIHVVDISGGVVFAYTQPITFAGGTLNPTSSPSEGAIWDGPLCGTTYSFAMLDAPHPPSNFFDEVTIDINGTPVQLSAECGVRPYPPTTGAVANFLRALRRQAPKGGGFRVNEHGRAFTSDGHRYVGTVPLQDGWFRPITVGP
jgi:hypothetical protein